MVTINVKNSSCIIESSRQVPEDLAHLLKQSKQVSAMTKDLGVTLRVEESDGKIESVCATTLPKNQCTELSKVGFDLTSKHDTIIKCATEELQKELNDANKEEQEFCEYSLICELINTLSRAKAVVLLLDRDEKI